MKRLFVALATLCTLGLLAGGQAQAQYSLRPGIGGGYTPPPAFSPYLNLARPGSPTLNYFGLVRPELAFRSGILGLQTGLEDTRLQLAATDRALQPQVRATG